MVPVAVNAPVMTGGGGVRTANRNVAEPVPAELLALMVTEKVPLTVGVPEIAPVAVSILRPAGSPVALKLAGLLLAVMA